MLNIPPEFIIAPLAVLVFYLLNKDSKTNKEIQRKLDEIHKKSLENGEKILKTLKK